MISEYPSKVNQNTPAPALITFGLSRAWLDKAQRPGAQQAHTRFVTTRGTLAQLFEHILSGNTWAPGAFKNDYRRTDNFISAELTGLDFDENVSIARLLELELFRRYACLLHATPSSGLKTDENGAPVYRTRALFRLDRPITSAAEYTRLYEALAAQAADLKPDKTCDAARMFHGSTNRFEQPYVNLGAVLPVDLLAQWADEIERSKPPVVIVPRHIADPGNTGAQKYAATAYQRMVDEAASSGDGAHNDTLFRVAVGAFSKALGGWPGFDYSRIEADLTTIARGWPNHDDKRIRATLNSARKRAHAEAFTLPDKPTRPTKPVIKPVSGALVTFTASEQVKARYASEIALNGRTIALKSPLNTGKTEAVIRQIQQQQPARVLFITHLQALTVNQAERLNRAGLTTELYAEIPNDYNLGAVNRLVCSVNSLYRLAGAAPYDLVVIDEMTQAVPHIWGGTLRGDEPAAAFATLRQLVEGAGQVIALDAHMSDREADWLQSVRGDCQRIENTYRHEWGTLDLYASEAALVAAAQARADENAGPVVLATGSRKAARRYYRLFVKHYGSEHVRAIHGWNSNSQDNRAFVAHINRDLPALRVLICSPSVATGIDITAPVAGVFGAFYAEPLTASDMLQMLARYRNSAQRGAFVSAVERELETDPEQMLGRVRNRVRRTAQLAEYAAHGVPVATLAQAEIVRLWARYEADRNRQKQNPRGAFCALAAVEGFTVRPVEADAPGMAEQLKAARADLRADDNALRLTLAPLAPDELEQRRMAGTISENDYLALDRWQIEDTTGQDITAPGLLDRYSSPRKLAALRRFTDYEAGAAAVQTLDRDEAVLLPMNRKHHTGPYWLFRGAVKDMFGAAGLQSVEVMSKAEAHRRAAAFTEKHLGDVQIYIDHRADLSSNPLAVVRRVFAAFGVYIAYRRARVENRLEYQYWLDAARLAVLRLDAERRRAHMAQKQQDREMFQNAGLQQGYSRVLEQQNASGGLLKRKPHVLAPLSPQEAARIAAIRF